MRKQSWVITIVVMLALVGLALSAPRWVPFLARFVQLNTDLIQGLADLVQLLLWIAAGTLVLLRGLGWRRAAPVGHLVDPEAGDESQDGRTAASALSPPPATYQATQTDDGAIAQGPGAQAASGGSIVIGAGQQRRKKEHRQDSQD